MSTVEHMKQNERLSSDASKPALAIFVSAWLVFGLLLVGHASAQDPAGAWSEPVNLSFSAAASEPVMVADSSGQIHVIWKEPDLNFVYTVYADGNWSNPVSVELPFGTRRYDLDLAERQPTPLYTPVLWADGEDGIHALWIDDDGRMFYSEVSSSNFADFVSWSAPRLMAASASFGAAISDSAGGLHIAYIRPAESDQSPSGLYYRQSADGGITWSLPVLLHESRYLRSLRPELVNLKLTTTANGEVFVVWDDPFQERVFATRSENGGADWGPPLEVDLRLESDGPDAVGPNGIQAVLAGDTIHLVWQAGHDGFNCSIYHQFSVDGGSSWQPRQRIAEPLPECRESTMLVNADDEKLLMLLATPEGGYSIAWNGSRWGPAQAFPELTRVMNPMNFREVELGCHQTAKVEADEQSSGATLTILGCDTGLGGDIWVQTAEIGQVIDEIAPLETPVWREPEPLGEPVDAESLQLLADGDGWLHAMWTQSLADDNPTRAIYYSRWDGAGWSRPRDLLTSPDGGSAVQPSVVLSSDGKIMVVWVDGRPGSIYFSQADLARAGNAAEWSNPVILPLPPAVGSSPEIAIDGDGVIHVVYARPLNEERGIYITKSSDGGEAWDDPVKIFDGSEAGWSMVDKPRMTVDGDGSLHLLWTRYTSPPESVPQAVYYARSIDDGESWSEAMEVVESEAVWSDMISSGDLALHRFWFTMAGDLWYQSSTDNGANWRQPLRVSGLTDALVVADVITDGAGRPWLLQVVGSRSATEEVGRPAELRSWVLSEGRWSAEEGVRLTGQEVEEISAAATGGGALEIVYSSPAMALKTNQEQLTIYHSGRDLDLPLLAPTPLPTLTATPLPAATRTPTPAPLPTATTVFPTEADQGDGLALPIDTSNPLTGPLLGIILAGLVVLVAFFIGVRLLRGDRR